MIRAFVLAFLQLTDPRIWRIVVLSLVVTLAIYGVLVTGLVWLLGHIALAHTPWLNTLERWGAGTGGVLLAIFFFPGVVTAVMALWQDAIADAVEARHYPGLPPARPVPVAEMLGAALRLVTLTIVLNLALLPIYLVLVFVPPLNIVAFVAVNGLLLGREYFDAVALRRLPADETGALRRFGRGRVWLTGTGAAVVLSVPILNLVGPVLATAAFVHVFHGLNQRPARHT